MNRHEQDTDPMGKYRDILVALGELRGRIDAAGYPGQSWPGPRRTRRLVIGVVGGSAAGVAAVILLAFALHGPTEAPLPSGQDATYVAPGPPVTPTAPVFEMSVPTNLDLRSTGPFALDISIPSVPEAKRIIPSGSLAWDVPSLSIPSLENHNKEQRQ
jgi:hypothetical protein